MLSRALSLATVLFLLGSVAAGEAHAQNLEAGKSPARIFAQTCSACHKSARGIVKTVPAGSLPGFLRQHYTTSSDMAGLLASYLISNGAIDPRHSGAQPQQAARPGMEAQPEIGHRGRHAKRRVRPTEPTEGAMPDEGSSQTTHRGRKSRRNLSEHPTWGTTWGVEGRAEGPAKVEADTSKGEREPAKVEQPKEQGSEAPASRPDSAAPAE